MLFVVFVNMIVDVVVSVLKTQQINLMLKIYRVDVSLPFIHT